MSNARTMEPITEHNDIARLLDAIAFAAERHKDQRRKDVRQTPYINHPLALARMLACEGGITDVEVLMAAVLHDTVEDTETTEADLRERFGDRVADMVMEVTDDKNLPKARRKALQVEHAHLKSDGAALVKLVDKTCNLADIASSPPAGWSLERRREYFDWAKRVVDGLPPVSVALRRCFDTAFARKSEF